MTSLDSVKRGSGATIIGGNNNQPVSAPTAPVIGSPILRKPTVIGAKPEPKIFREQVSENIVQDAQVDKALPVLAVPPRPVTNMLKVELPGSNSTLTLEGDQSIAPLPQVFAEPLIKQQLPLTQELLDTTKQPQKESPKSDTILESQLREFSPTHAPMKQALEKARNTFIAPLLEEAPVPTGLADIIQAAPLPQTLYDTTSKQYTTKPKKKSKLYRVPLYFSVFALIMAGVAATLGWFFNKPNTAQANTSSESSTALPSKVTVNTLLAKNSLDPDKKESKEFVKGDPIQICINYVSQPANSLIQIKVTREVDGGSQLEIISTRINTVGSDVRCLPFTGAQAVSGKYTIEVGTAQDVVSTFIKASDTKFVITEAPTKVVE